MLHGGQHAQHLHGGKEEFGIAVIPAVVTDNAANMVSAAEGAEIAHVPCFAHALQLGVTEGLKTPRAARAIAAGRRLVGHFNHSAMSTQALMLDLSVALCYLMTRSRSPLTGRNWTSKMETG